MQISVRLLIKCRRLTGGDKSLVVDLLCFEEEGARNIICHCPVSVGPKIDLSVWIIASVVVVDDSIGY